MRALNSSIFGPTFTRCRLSPNRQRTVGEHRLMKRTAAVALLALAFTSAPRLIAQMRPGAKVEKTYGVGLPRDMDRLLIPDAEYPVYPLKPGQEAYADVDGYRIKENHQEESPVILAPRAWMRANCTGATSPARSITRWPWISWPLNTPGLACEGRRQPVDMTPLWYPTKLTASDAAAGTRTGTLRDDVPDQRDEGPRRPLASRRMLYGSASARRPTSKAAISKARQCRLQHVRARWTQPFGQRTGRAFSTRTRSPRRRARP